MAERVFVHIGSPKTGTTYLQTVLWDHRDVLREQHGLLYPGDRYDEHFLAAVDLQDGLFHGSPRPESQGHWQRVVEQARAWPGTVVISHEILAGAAAEHARRVVADLAPAEVHIVHTIRDLGRQLPSRWQEDVKHGAIDTFDEWWTSVSERDESHHFTRWFWPTEDPLDILSRWGSAVPPERYHVISVPRSGSASLWERFCSVIGVDAAAVDVAAATISNAALGPTEVELVRRVNVALDSSLTPTDYQSLVKGALAHDTLSRRGGGPRLALPAALLPEVEQISRRWLAGLRESGVDLLVQDDEVLPCPSSTAGASGGPAEEELAGTAVWALRELLLRLQDERRHHAEVGRRLEADRRELEVRNQELTEELGRVRARLERLDVLGRMRRHLVQGRPVRRHAVSTAVPVDG